MNFVINLFVNSAVNVWNSLLHNWPFLLASILIAAALKLYLEPERVSAFLLRFQRASVLGATAAAVVTPLCSCGTTAVILGMMAGSIPWAPIVAFMVSSPLTSPEELIYSAGIFGWRFAWAFFISSIVLGLVGGLAAAFLDRRSWLAGQSRFEKKGCACSCEPGKGCSPVQQPVTPRLFAAESIRTAKRLLAMFLGFGFIGYFLNGLIPPEWVGMVFGSGKLYGVPLAATLGLPLYVNTEASLPLVRALIDAGMSQGAALAFLITGAGTSFGAVAGALTIARWRVIALVVGTLWVGAVCMGMIYNWVA
jgi:uncharacterized protein